MAKLRIPKISLLEWLAKAESADNVPDQTDSESKSVPANLRVTSDFGVKERSPLLADNPDLVGDTLMVEHWNCIPELTAPADEPSEIIPSLTSKDKSKAGKTKERKAKDKPSAALASQVDTTPPEHNHPFANFSADSLEVIASNPRTPSTTLCWLATHFNPDVRLVVAKNDNALPETIWLLARDYEEAVRLAVAEHQQNHENVLKALCLDKSPLVSWHARQTLDRLEKQKTEHTEESSEKSKLNRQTADVIAVMQQQALTKFNNSVDNIEFLKLIASKTTTPAYRLATLAKHPNHEIRGLVAENTNAPREVLWLLAKDDVVEVKAKLTDNYNCPIEVLEYLQDDQDSYVAWQSKNIMAKLLGKEVPTVFEDDSSFSSQRLLHTL